MVNEGMRWEDRIDLICDKYDTMIKDFPKFRRWMMKRKVVGHNIDDIMIVKCYNIYKRITEMNDDHFLVCVGQEGVGKSTYLLNVCSMVDPTFNADRICYTLNQFLDFVKASKPGQSVLIDEGGTVLYSRQAMSALNIGLTKLFTIMRQKNLFVAIAIPNFFVLDTYVRNHRVNSVVDIPKRGKYRLVSDHLNRVSILKLNKEGMQSKDVAKVKPIPGTGFRGDFSKSLPGNLDEDEYMIRKNNHLESLVDELKQMKEDEPSKSKYVKVRDVAKKLNFDDGTIRKMLIDGRLKGKKIGTSWFVFREEFENL